MPKLPRLSGSDCISALERLGFVQKRSEAATWS
jgi:predicted RNA binding protein YcfA (HicA-like mRNA interferase family)